MVISGLFVSVQGGSRCLPSWPCGARRHDDDVGDSREDMIIMMRMIRRTNQHEGGKKKYNNINRINIYNILLLIKNKKYNNK